MNFDDADEEVRARDLQVGDVFRDFGDDEWTRITSIANEGGDNVFINSTSPFDGDSVVLRRLTPRTEEAHGPDPRAGG